MRRRYHLSRPSHQRPTPDVRSAQSRLSATHRSSLLAAPGSRRGKSGTPACTDDDAVALNDPCNSQESCAVTGCVERQWRQRRRRRTDRLRARFNASAITPLTGRSRPDSTGDSVAGRSPRVSVSVTKVLMRLPRQHNPDVASWAGEVRATLARADLAWLVRRRRRLRCSNQVFCAATGSRESG